MESQNEINSCEVAGGIEETKDNYETIHSDVRVFESPQQLDDLIEEKLYEQKLNHCIEKLDIKDNDEAIKKLKTYLDNPDMIYEIITEEDIFNLFIDNFKKLI